MNLAAVSFSVDDSEAKIGKLNTCAPYYSHEVLERLNPLSFSLVDGGLPSGGCSIFFSVGLTLYIQIFQGAKKPKI